MMRFAAALLCVGLLAGCGVRGGLERPAPLWGSPDESALESQERAAEQLEERRRQSENEPGDLTETIPPLPE